MKEKEPTIDLSYLLELGGGDPHFVVEMLQTFLGEIPNMLQSLEACLQTKDKINLAKMAHKMKPNLLMIGLQEEQELARSIELLAKESSEPFPTSLIEDAQILLSNVRRVLPILELKIEELKP